MSVLDLKPENFTPVMQQYLNERQKLSGRSVLFFRMGDFYEAFFEDAELIARELEITLTGRPEQNYPGGRIPMAGMPARAVKPYIAKLLERNFKVCIAEQMADPKTCKGLVPREITKIFTPGTISDLEFLDSYQNNFILAIFSGDEKTYGLAYADISTGEFYSTAIPVAELEQELSRIRAAEILIPSAPGKKLEGQIVAEEVLVLNLNHLKNKYNVSPFHQNNFTDKLAKANLEEVFKLQNPERFFSDSLNSQLALRASGAVIEYLKETHSQDFLSIIKNFSSIKTYQVTNYMILDPSTRRNLELTQTLSGRADGSFFSAIDRTSSKAGRRKLRSWLEQPLLDINHIQARQEAITELAREQELTNALAELLRKTYDIDRLSSRLITELISPREALALKDSLLVSTEISSLMQDIHSPLLSSLKYIPDLVMDYIREVESSIKEDPGINITEGGIIKPGHSEELDQYISLVEDSEAWLKAYEEEERNKTGIKNLKVSFNKVHGYYIETSRLNQNKLLDEHIIKQTMVNTIRAISPELKDFEEKITNAESRRNALEYKLYTELKERLATKAGIIKELGIKIAELDALVALTKLALENNYSCPIIDESYDLVIEAGRHPVVEQKLKLGQFVPNDINLGTENSTAIMILTGPNMAGKSTYMRQNALIVLLAQMGSYVPAAYARIGLVDRIFTRIGASDDLSSGQSTFMVEMTETAVILSGMSERSFIVFDEIGRGTSTYDGVAIAWSIVEYLAKTTKARTIFATHYHELANLDRLHPCIKNYQVLVVENGSEIEFLHKVSEGSADKSYGIEVARLAGLPKAVLERARAINHQLQASRTKRLGLSKRTNDIEFALMDDGTMDLEKLPLFESGN